MHYLKIAASNSVHDCFRTSRAFVALDQADIYKQLQDASLPVNGVVDLPRNNAEYDGHPLETVLIVANALETDDNILVRSVQPGTPLAIPAARHL
ncbi:hypothetical protein [Pseudomonas sp. MPC6]|uniref:hypothetical protein n=1 Tax=unclassified Pseudomonas TaxID=196821 RepID=UPI001110239E|nr:hypothetical protein [Pseudomonas sp. MPC6]QCY12297.1 hypothetical protein ELQ88_16705 [Pseudomonas sp. MPC6]